jgi:hypothetical protein
MTAGIKQHIIYILHARKKASNTNHGLYSRQGSVTAYHIKTTGVRGSLGPHQESAELDYPALRLALGETQVAKHAADL